MLSSIGLPRLVHNVSVRRLATAHQQMRRMSVFSSDRLIGKTALVTGASSGIGASTAQLFAKAGSNLVLVARRRANLEEVKEKCEAALKAGGFNDAKVVVIEADMQNREAIDKILPAIQKSGLKVDILVNNAGLVKGRDQIGEISNEDIDVMFQTNVIGLIHLTQAAVREFKKQKSGFIINLGSVAGREAYPGGSIYCATKFAVAAFNESLRKELINEPGIRVAEIQPGMVETEFSIVRYHGDKTRAHNEYKGLDPLTGDDIAEEIVWIASRAPHVQIAQVLMFPSQQGAATLNWRRPE